MNAFCMLSYIMVSIHANARRFKVAMTMGQIIKKLLEKLSDKDIQALNQNVRFTKLYNIVNLL